LCWKFARWYRSTRTDAGVQQSKLFEGNARGSMIEAALILFEVPTKNVELADRQLLDFVPQQVRLQVRRYVSFRRGCLLRIGVPKECYKSQQ